MMTPAPAPAPEPPDGGPAEDVVVAGPPPRRARLEVVRHWWDGVPMRARLVGILIVLLVAALAATGVGTQIVLKQYLAKQVDQDLSASAVQQVLNALSNAERMPSQNNSLPSQYVVQWVQNGEPLASRSNHQVQEHPGLAPKFPTMTTEQAVKERGHLYTVMSKDGTQRWRLTVYPLVDNPPGGPVVIGWMIVGLSLNQADGAIHRLQLIFLGLGAALILLCALLGWLAIRRACLPLPEVEETAAAIAAGDLSRRVPDHPKSTEVGRLTSSLNGMLAQIESAFRSREASEQRTRRFAADASHELRTPLASIRGFAELYRQGAVREPEDVARTMGRIEDESRRMGALVEDLLLLARLDEQRPSRTDPVDLAVLAGDATHDARGLAPDRLVRLVGLTPGRGPEPTVVIGDDNRLRQVVANLVGNADRHTPAGTPIEVAVGADGDLAILEVRDHGPGLPPEHAKKVFERFYRVDASRARSQGGGSGLGLSIVTAVVSSHGGRVGVAHTPGGGATFRVELPLASVAVAEDVVDLEADLDAEPDQPGPSGDSWYAR
jgi:two-component system OmpR family sensor kinase